MSFEFVESRDFCFVLFVFHSIRHPETNADEGIRKHLPTVPAAKGVFLSRPECRARKNTKMRFF